MSKRHKSRRTRIRFDMTDRSNMTSGSREELLGNSQDGIRNSQNDLRNTYERPLTREEKTFLLHADRGDYSTVEKLIQEYKNKPELLDINCVDPLNRSALIAAIENENIELIRLLLEAGIKVNDALLHAIKEEYVEAVEMLLQWEETHHVPGEPYSWESIDTASATFTSDITPLILAAHRNHYEILKILLDRGATLPVPHDVKCGCDECVKSSSEDSLRHSQSRINAYRALSSPSLIALSSADPVLTAFELSWELAKLSVLETEFRIEYRSLRQQVQEFATSLLDHTRTSTELEIMLNYNPWDMDSWEPGERQTLGRLKLAINYKQKMFVAHPNVQQLLGAIWYDGLPGFKRKNMVGQCIQVAKLGAMFPVYCSIYMMSPESEYGQYMKKPFVKFICHSSSYMFFLMLLSLASQRAEYLVLEYSGISWLQELVEFWKQRERGSLPGLIEFTIIIYIASLIWGEIRSLWNGGLMEYVSDLWNIVDFITNMFYVGWISLRFTSWYIVQRDYHMGKDPWYPRERWDAFDPMLLSEGAFAAGMIFSYLKLVHIFSINPYLGPLQVSLGRMIIDIIKFFFVYMLVLFAFGCGLNQMMWYYAELEQRKCYHLPNGLPDFDNQERACTIWRRFANLFETSQSLFWASFGLVDLTAFELTGIKSFTRFWALLTFGSYSVINIIVLLNMLIAMMSNSYQIISERADIEWKFARSNLWMSYFEDGDTVPPPFNIIPTPKHVNGWIKNVCSKRDRGSIINKSREKARQQHEAVMRVLVRRYVTAEQRARDEVGVTEDDVMEVRQDISTLRYELFDIFATNGMKTPRVKDQATIAGKKGKVMERRILKDFQIGIVEGIIKDVITKEGKPKDVFSQIAKAIQRKGSEQEKKKDWNAQVRRSTLRRNPIGSAAHRQSLRQHILDNVEGKTIDPQKLLEYNPQLETVTPTTRVAYAKFMKKKIKSDFSEKEKSDEDAAKTSKPAAAAAAKIKLPLPIRVKSPIPEGSDEETANVKEIKVKAEIEKQGSQAKAAEGDKAAEPQPSSSTDKPTTPQPSTSTAAPAAAPAAPKPAPAADKPATSQPPAEKPAPKPEPKPEKPKSPEKPAAKPEEKKETVIQMEEPGSPSKNLYMTKEEDKNLQKPMTPTQSGPQEQILSASALEKQAEKTEVKVTITEDASKPKEEKTEKAEKTDKPEKPKKPKPAPAAAPPPPTKQITDKGRSKVTGKMVSGWL